MAGKIWEPNDSRHTDNPEHALQLLGAGMSIAPVALRLQVTYALVHRFARESGIAKERAAEHTADARMLEQLVQLRRDGAVSRPVVRAAMRSLAPEEMTELLHATTA